MVSVRLISMPPKRPPHWILAPSAPLRIVLVSARFIVRRKAARPSSCSAIDSATSAALSSGRETSRTLTCTLLPVMRSSSPLKASTSLPPLPITMPVLAQKLRVVPVRVPAALEVYLLAFALYPEPEALRVYFLSHLLFLLALGRIYCNRGAQGGLQLNRYVAGPLADHGGPAHSPRPVTLY